MELENHIKKANMLTDYKIQVLELEKIQRELDLNYIENREKRAVQLETLTEEIKKLTEQESSFGIDIIR